nr:hypothetical protein [Deltaproteobacteria bacterium]
DGTRFAVIGGVGVTVFAATGETVWELNSYRHNIMGHDYTAALSGDGRRIAIGYRME